MMTHIAWVIYSVFEYDSYWNWFRMYSDDSLDEYDADNVEYLNEFDDSPLGRVFKLMLASDWLIHRAPSSGFSLKNPNKNHQYHPHQYKDWKILTVSISCTILLMIPATITATTSIASSSMLQWQAANSFQQSQKSIQQQIKINKQPETTTHRNSSKTVTSSSQNINSSNMENNKKCKQQSTTKD